MLFLLAAAASAAVPAVARAQIGEGMGPPRQQEQPPAVIEAKKLSKLPKQTKFVEAEYPAEAVEKGLETDVILLLDINAQGKIDSVGVNQGGQPPGIGFDEAAIVAAQQFEFEPAEMDGKPIAIQLQYRYKFRLKPKAPPATPAPVTTPDGGAPPPAPVTPIKPAREPVVNFSGMLRERGTRLPIAGAVVTVFRDDVNGKSVGFEAAADAEGKFRFYDLPPSDWKVLVEPAGFYPFRTTETVRANEAVDVTYYVERGVYNPFDVTVTATRPRKEVSRTVISAGEIDKIPGAAGDPLGVVQNFAGVGRAPFGFAGLIIVRGAAPEDTQIFVDGSIVPNIYHFGGLRSVIPVGILDSIEFYPGNFSPMYGRAIGGIIDVQIKRLQPKKIGGYADVNIFDTGVFLEIPLANKGGVAIAGRRSYFDVLLNAAVPENSPNSFVTAPRYYDYQLVANYRPAPAHDIRVFAFGSDDRLALLFGNPADLDAEAATNRLSATSTFYRGTASYKYVPNTKLENNLRASWGQDWQNFNAGRLFFNFSLMTAQLRDNFRYKFSDKWALHAGLDSLLASTDINIRLPLPPKEGEPPGPFDPNNTISRKLNNEVFFSQAAFAELEWKPTPRWLILPGFRVDYFSRIRQTVPQPRLTARWQFIDRFTAKAGVGLFAQEPFFDETDAAFGNPSVEVGARAAHVGGRRVQAAAAPDVRRHRLLQGPVEPGQLHRHRGRDGQSAALRQQRQGAHLRHGAGRAPRVRQPADGVDRVHAAALRAPGLRRDRIPPVRLRPDPHPDHGRHLPAAEELADRRPHARRQRQPEHSRHRIGVQRQRRSLRPHLWRRQHVAQPAVPPAGRAARQALDLQELDPRDLPGDPEHLQPGQLRGAALQLQLPPER